MKLRCTHNSIRLRLVKSDLRQLQQAGKIMEGVSFPGQLAFKFGIQLKEDISTPMAEFEATTIILNLPTQQAQSWANSDQVGIEAYQSLEKGEQLHILIEKDFPCLDRENEDKSDTFWELAGEGEAC